MNASGKLRTPSPAPIFAGLLGVVCVAACSGAPDGNPPPLPEVPGGQGFATVEGVGLEAPQSVLYDSVADRYLVSNLPASPSPSPSPGFISRLRPDGRVEALRWIDGAGPEAPIRQPRGMATRGDTLLAARGK